MQNNSIFRVNLLLFPVKTKTEIKYNPHVIHIRFPYFLRGPCRVVAPQWTSRSVCHRALHHPAPSLLKGLTSPSTHGSLVKTQENLTNSHDITMTPLAQQSNYITTSFCYLWPPGSKNIFWYWSTYSPAGCIYLPGTSWMDKNDILCLLRVTRCSEGLTGLISFNLHNNLMK